jgi:predicted enzyme related to lactoylglutathione lyase
MSLTLTTALLTIAAQDFQALVEFYQQLLGQNPAVLMPNTYAEFHLPGVIFGIFQPKIQNPKSKIQNSPGSPTASNMALCLDVANLEVAIAHLTQLGYPPLGDIRIASHGREIDAYDPEGNWLILHRREGSATSQGFVSH